MLVIRVGLCTTFLTLVVLCFFLQSHHVFQICEGLSSLDLDSVKRSTESDHSEVKRDCTGNIVNGECSDMNLEDEMMIMMESESSRRVLLMQQKRYISYDTLKRDLVPCDRAGASYYNCRGPGVANFYTRGCEIITRCARGD